MKTTVVPLDTDFGYCRHCGAPIVRQLTRPRLIVHAGTRSWRCPGPGVQTEAEYYDEDELEEIEW